MNAAHQLGQTVGRAAACRALNVPRASLYRHLRPPTELAVPPAPRPSPPRALTTTERQQVLDVLHEERFRDKGRPKSLPRCWMRALTCAPCAPCTASSKTPARSASAAISSATHPHYQKPQLLATAPNQVWSWDITKLLGPVKWT